MAYFIAHLLLAGAAMQASVSRVAFAATVLAIALIYIVVALFPFLRGEDFGLGWGAFGSAITFSRILILAVCVSIAFALEPVRWRWGFAVLAAVFICALVASVQKAALVSVAAGGFVFLVKLSERASPRVLAATTLVAVLAVALAGTLFYDRIAYRFGQMLLPDVDVPVVERVYLPEDALYRADIRYCVLDEKDQPDCRETTFIDGSQRLIFLSEAFRGLAESPVFGQGAGAYRVSVIHPSQLRPDHYSYPHNLFAEVAFEGGLIGLGLLAAAFIAMYMGIRRSAAPWSAVTAGATFIAAFLVATQFNGDLYDSRWLWLAAAAIVCWPQRGAAPAAKGEY
jgi:O-antigen ligase